MEKNIVLGHECLCIKDRWKQAAGLLILSIRLQSGFIDDNL